MARRPAKAAVVIMCLWVRVLGQLGCGLRKLQGPAETLRSLLALHLFHALWKKDADAAATRSPPPNYRQNTRQNTCIILMPRRV